ncbi:MAG: sigma-70 family RNA polymerase sigma factor [Moorea sp. SIO2I5]|nr:sigma-70 family RNA polymerase sigma factor [Moorena sp. SIO2I5]
MWNQQQDEKLRQLATEAQDYPPKTRMRQIALTKLVKAIRKSGQLCRPHRGKFIGFYEEIYDEACNRVFLYLCQNIDKYDPNKGEVLQWVNFLIRKRFPDAVNSILGTLAIFPEDSSIKRVSIDELDQLKYHQNNPLLSSELIAWIESDPDGIFQETYVTNHPEANFKFLALKRLEGYSWKDLESNLGISLKTLSGFHDRCLNKFSNQLKDYLN